MATSIFNTAPTSSSDVAWRGWGSGLSTALAAVGLVKTADTGQINWTTSTRPLATYTQMGYEMWRFDDALQATAPVFLRIGYGSGNQSTTPAIWVSLGKGSDGAGNLTSLLMSEQHVFAPVAGSATPQNWYVSGDKSMLCLAFPPLWGSSFTVVERSRTPAGAATATGLLQTTAGTATYPNFRTINYAAASLYTVGRWPVGLPVDSSSNSNITFGTTAPVFPAAVPDALGNWWQPRSILVGMRGDLGSLAPFTAGGFGTYMPLGAIPYWDAQFGTYASPCIWWQ